MHLTAPAQFGGLESVVSGLASASAARGHDVTVFLALSPSAPVPSWTAALERAGVRIAAEHVGNRAYLTERRLVRALLARVNPDIVHTHGYRSDVLHAGVAHGRGIPVVSTAHGFSGKIGGLAFNERMQVWSWRRFDRVVAVSDALQAHLVSLGVPATRLTVIRNGLIAPPPPLDRDEARRALGIPASPFVVGWVGRLSAEKDPLLAVEAFSALNEDSAVLCVVGDGPERAVCEARAEALGIGGRVHFVGAKPDAAQLLSAFDALLLSSRTEGTPMIILEAALATVPIVATAVGGVPAVVGGDGLLCPPGDAQALGRALQSVLKDRAGARERAAVLSARLRAEEEQDDWVGQYLALYHSLVRAK